MTKEKCRELLRTGICTSTSSGLLRRLFYRFVDFYLNPSHHAPAERDGIYTKLYSMSLAELVETYGFNEGVLQKVKLRFQLFMPQSIIKSWANIKQTLSK